MAASMSTSAPMLKAVHRALASRKKLSSITPIRSDSGAPATVTPNPAKQKAMDLRARRSNGPNPRGNAYGLRAKQAGVSVADIKGTSTNGGKSSLQNGLQAAAKRAVTPASRKKRRPNSSSGLSYDGVPGGFKSLS